MEGRAISGETSGGAISAEDYCGGGGGWEEKAEEDEEEEGKKIRGAERYRMAPGLAAPGSTVFGCWVQPIRVLPFGPIFVILPRHRVMELLSGKQCSPASSRISGYAIRHFAILQRTVYFVGFPA